MSLNNSAAWLTAKRVKPLKIGPAPYTTPGANEIVVKNGAVAINPVDWAKQMLGDLLLPYIKYPFILGGDVAGEVCEVGSDVQRFKIGDRVLGHAVGGAVASNNPAEGAFQEYTIIREYFASAIPDEISYERACVLPLTLSTAAYGLFHKDFLALDPPTVPRPSAIAGQQAIIITGGASSIGCNAIQLAVSAGYQVYSTSSPKNFTYVEKLGATRVFDYHGATLVQDMIAELQDKKLAGAYAIGDNAVEVCTKVLRQCPETDKKFIALAGTSLPSEQLGTFMGKVSYAGSLLWCFGKMAITSRATGVQVKFIDAKDLCEPHNVVSRLVYKDFLPRALASGQFVPAPEPLVVGKGLEKIQDAMDVQMKGVSAQKVVVSL